jgi:AraC-like DNA-binding protein
LRIAAEDAAPVVAAALTAGIADAAELGCTLPLGRYFDLQSRLVRESGDETGGFSQRAVLPGTTEFVLSGLAPEQGAEEQLRRIATAFNCAHGGRYNQVERIGERLMFRIDVRGFPFTAPAEHPVTIAFMEGVLIFLHALVDCVMLGCGEPALRRVRTRRASHPPGHGLLEFWSAPVRCGGEDYALEYNAARLDAYRRGGGAAAGRHRLTPADVHLRLLEMIAAREEAVSVLSPVDQVRTLVEHGVGDLPQVAEHLGCSVATLRRRLSASGVTFRALRQETLGALAARRLREGWRPAHVAESLGFSDLRSFSRAFRAWTGASPSAFARRASASPRSGSTPPRL